MVLKLVVVTVQLPIRMMPLWWVALLERVAATEAAGTMVAIVVFWHGFWKARCYVG